MSLSDYSKCIVVADPAKHTPELDCFSIISCMSPLPCTYHLPCLFGVRSLLEIPKELITGILVLGSSSSVNDSMPWQEPFNAWLSEMMQTGVPTFGFCYGHQLISHLFGARVEFAFPSKEKFKGFRQIKFLSDTRLSTQSGQVPLVVSHNEIVSSVPSDFDLWATSDDCKNDGFRHRSLPIWTLQSHPEAGNIFLDDRGIPRPGDRDSFEPGHGLIHKFLTFCSAQP